MGVGLMINVITKSGGNMFKGSGAFAYQPYGWNGNNVANCSASAPAAGPAPAARRRRPYMRQFDGGVGGPMMRDKVWFFGSLRRACRRAGISRTAVEVAAHRGVLSRSAELFNNTRRAGSRTSR